MERLEVLELLAHAGEFDRLVRHRPKAEGGAAAGIAVQLGEDAAGNGQRLIEVRRHVHGFLAGGRVQDQKNLVGLDEVAQADQLLNERLVDLQPAGGIENEGVAILGRGEAQRLARDVEHVRFALLHENGHAQFFAQCGQLVHGRGPGDVQRDEQRLATLLLQEAGQLARAGGLARAVQPDQHQAGRGAPKIQRGVLAAEQHDEFVVDNLDDLLAGRDALDDLGAQGFLAHPVDELLDDLEIDVGVEQRQPHVTQAVGDVAFGNLAQPAKVAEDVLELAAQVVEHAGSLGWNGAGGKRRERIQ